MHSAGFQSVRSSSAMRNPQRRRSTAHSATGSVKRMATHAQTTARNPCGMAHTPAATDRASLIIWHSSDARGRPLARSTSLHGEETTAISAEESAQSPTTGTASIHWLPSSTLVARSR